VDNAGDLLRGQSCKEKKKTASCFVNFMAAEKLAVWWGVKEARF